MSDERFKIVLDELEGVRQEEGSGHDLVAEVGDLAEELDEIAELRRFAEAMVEPPSKTYTST